MYGAMILRAGRTQLLVKVERNVKNPLEALRQCICDYLASRPGKLHMAGKDTPDFNWEDAYGIPAEYRDPHGIVSIEPVDPTFTYCVEPENHFTGNVNDVREELGYGRQQISIEPLIERPRHQCGVEYGCDRFVLVRKGKRELIWCGPGTHWQDRMSGHVYDPTELNLVDWTDSPGIGRETRLQTGGRFSRKSIQENAEAIMEFFGMDEGWLGKISRSHTIVMEEES